MFDGFGLFGTGIGTGIMGKIEDMALGVRNGVEDLGRTITTPTTKYDAADDSDVNDSNSNRFRIAKEDDFDKNSKLSKMLLKAKSAEIGFTGIDSMLTTHFTDGVINSWIQKRLDRVNISGEDIMKEIYNMIDSGKRDEAIKMVSYYWGLSMGHVDRVFEFYEGDLSNSMSDRTKRNNNREIVDIMQYLSGNQEFLTLLVSARNGKLSGREFAVKINEMKDNANVELDFGKMLSDRINKKESSDNSSKEWGTFLAEQPEEVKVIIWEKIKEAQKNLLEEISFLEEIIGFAKKEQAGKLSQKDMARASKNIARWKECIEKAKHKERELRLHSELQDEKQEVSLEEVEQALSAIKEQVGTV